MSTTETEGFAAQWARARGFVVELPSGKKLRMIRSLDLMGALKAGMIPNPLRDVLSEMIEKKVPSIPADKRADPELLAQMANLIDETVCRACIDPKVYKVPEGQDPQTWYPDDPNGISIVDLSQDDRNFINTVAQGGATDLEQFRKEQAKLMDVVANGGSVPEAPKRTTRSRTRKR